MKIEIEKYEYPHTDTYRITEKIISDNLDLHGLIHGWNRVYKKNNNLLISESYYEFGKRNGTKRLFWVNGNIREEIPYINGKVYGIVKAWYYNGSLKNSLTVYNSLSLTSGIRIFFLYKNIFGRKNGRN